VHVKVGSLGIKMPNARQSTNYNQSISQGEPPNSSPNRTEIQSRAREQGRTNRRTTSIDSKNLRSDSFDEMVEDDDDFEEETAAEKKTKLDLLKGIIPIEFRDNF
jgi:hypothetical protein